MKDNLSHIVSRRRFLSLMGGAALTLEADENRMTFRCFLPNGLQKDFVTLRNAPTLEE